VLVSDFWDGDGILLGDRVENGANIAERKKYVALLNKLKQQLVAELQGKLWKVILFLQGDASPQKAAIMQSSL
jgi:hypothetical protein